MRLPKWLRRKHPIQEVYAAGRYAIIYDAECVRVVCFRCGRQWDKATVRKCKCK